MKELLKEKFEEEPVMGLLVGAFFFLILGFGCLLFVTAVVGIHDGLVCRAKTGFFQCQLTENKQQKIQLEMKNE